MKVYTSVDDFIKYEGDYHSTKTPEGKLIMIDGVIIELILKGRLILAIKGSETRHVFFDTKKEAKEYFNSVYP